MDNEKLNDAMLEQVDGGARIVYQVQAGETLEAIAQNKHVSVEQLIRWNKIEDPNVVPVGTKLTIKY